LTTETEGKQDTLPVNQEWEEELTPITCSNPDRGVRRNLTVQPSELGADWYLSDEFGVVLTCGRCDDRTVFTYKGNSVVFAPGKIAYGTVGAAPAK